MSIRKTNIVLTILVLMLFLSALTINVSRVHAIAEVSVEPSSQTVGQPSLPLPTPAFPVSITVSSVVDLSDWQIVLYYNSTSLNFNSYTLPPGHVFDGKGYSPLFHPPDTDSSGTYVIIGAVLYSGSTFSGSGTLCQINFTGQTTGTSSLRLNITTAPEKGSYYTFMLDSGMSEIPISINNGQVTVVGLETLKRPSSIAINVDHGTVPIGSNVTVSGDINVTRSGLVTLSYRASGSAEWSELIRVSINATTGHYVYSWNTTDTEIKVYELKSSWLGDVEYEGAESGIVTVTITKRTSAISFYVHPINVTAGSRVTIKGAITPNPTSSTRPGVTISVRLVNGSWTGNWTVLEPELQPVQTDLDGNYTFIWITRTVGSYELMASWPGDENYEGAESITKAVGVTPAPPFDIMAYLPYIVAAVAIVAIMGIAVYFIKFKKR